MRVPNFQSFVNERMGFPNAVGPMAATIANRIVRYAAGTLPAVLRHMKPLPALHITLQLPNTEEFPLKAVELIGSYEIKREDGGKGFRPWVSGEFAGTYAGEFGLTARMMLAVQVSEWGIRDDAHWAKNMHAEVESAAAHELTHAYEAYKRERHRAHEMTMSKDGIFDGGAREIKGKFDDPRNVPQALSNLLFIQYLCASYEVNARAAGVFPFLKGKRTNDERLEAVKSSPMWNEAQEMLNFSARATYDELLDKYESDEQLDYFMHKLDSTFTSLAPKMMRAFSFDPDSRIEWSDRQRIIDYFSSHDAQQVASIAGKTTRAYLAYWEKRAHRAGEDLRRRLLRAVAY